MIITQAKKIKVEICNFNTFDLIYFRCANLKNKNGSYFFGDDFTNSGIPILNFFHYTPLTNDLEVMDINSFWSIALRTH